MVLCDTDIQTWIGSGHGISRKEKKLRLKQIRSYASIATANEQKLSNIFSPQNKPTCYIYVGGGGAACGVTYDQCYKTFSKFGDIQKLMMWGLRSFCFVIYAHCDAAKEARKHLHKQNVKSMNNRILFIEYGKNNLKKCLHGEIANAVSLSAKRNPTNCVPTNKLVEHIQLMSHSSIMENQSQQIIPGLLLILDFVTIDEEQGLLAFFKKQKWVQYNFRHVLHYGYEFDYSRNNVDPQKPLPNAFPDIISPLLERMSCLGNITTTTNNTTLATTSTDVKITVTTAAPTASTDHVFDITETSNYQSKSFINHSIKYVNHSNSYKPDQITVNKYLPGHGIPPHVDTHSPFEECLASLSLASSIVMQFSRTKNGVVEKKYVPLPRRSLLILTGSARYEWMHAIPPRKTDRIDGKLVERDTRISLTFRKIKKTPCCCNFPVLCDSQQNKHTNI